MLRRFLPRLRDKAPGVDHVVAHHRLGLPKRDLRHVIILKAGFAGVVVLRGSIHAL